MVNSSEFRIGQYREDDYRKDAPHFTKKPYSDTKIRFTGTYNF